MMPPRSAYVKHCSAIMSSFQFVDVPDAELGKFPVEAVKVQSQLARFEAFAGLLFFFKPLGAEPSHFRSRFESHDNNPILIGNNHVARSNTFSDVHTLQ